MIPSLPILSVNGWENNPRAIMIKLYQHYLASEYSQTNMFNNEIASLKYDVAVSTGINNIKDNITKSLTKLYNAYYKTAAINVTVEEDTTKELIRYGINIMTTWHDGVDYTLSEEIVTSGLTSNAIITSRDKIMEMFE